MPPRPPGPYPLDRVAMPTWILRYDKHGTCTSPLTRAALLDHLRAGAYTDVIVFSHGWNNAFDDAVGLYAEFLRSFEREVASHPPGRPFQPLFLGIVWPSTWLVFDKGPRIAAAVDAAEEPVLDDLAETLAGKGADVERFYALMEKDRLEDGEAEEFARLVAPAFDGLPEDENQDGPGEADAGDVLAALRELERAEEPGGGAAPSVDDWGAIGGGGGAPAEPLAAGGLGRLDPRAAVRLFSVYQMKDRAGTVGYRGIGRLLREVIAATPARVHVAGHSYGCKVVLSALCEPAPLPRAVESLLLLQPAVSHLCFADSVPGHGREGGYRRALDPSRVRPPIFSTYSKSDFPLHGAFHLGVRRDADLGEARIAAEVPTTAGDPPNRYAALGGYGPRRAGQKLVDPLPAAGTAYPSVAGHPVVGFDGSGGVIRGHGDVSGPATAWALYQLAFRQP